MLIPNDIRCPYRIKGHRHVSILLNFSLGYVIGQAINDRPEAMQNRPLARNALLLGIVVNLGLLGYFKYAGFISENTNAVLVAMGAGALVPVLKVTLPLGISFFAFQGISYLMDIYRGDIRPTNNLFTFATYKAMFPQLIAGPIVRYADVVNDMGDRRVASDEVFAGIGRFCRGLAKKVLIADTMAQSADAIFALSGSELGTSVAWLGVIAYTLQIYFDFSAYSDMAIGMGRMMGFKYPENFDHPYTASSIRDFWRRWHMTLSSWFRDYVYISLGGNRLGPIRTYANLLIIFFLTGLWHGASWTFVAWGLWHGAFMILERRFNPDGWPMPVALRRVYTLIVVMIGWVLFRADTFAGAGKMLRAMFGMQGSSDSQLPLAAFTDPVVLGTLIAGVIFSMPAYDWVRRRVPDFWSLPGHVVGAFVLVSLASMKVLSGAYSPFLYFRF